MADRPEVDAITGTATTGHVWDDIRELNTPLPRWWLWTFYITIVWAIGYWIVYPAWPMLWSHSTGILHYSSRADVAVELANLEKIRGDKMVVLGAAPLAEIEKDPALLALARARGKTVFGDNCAPCHGSGASIERASFSHTSGWVEERIIVRLSSPEGSSNASRLREHSRTGRRSCSPTSRRASSTRRPVPR